MVCACIDVNMDILDGQVLPRLARRRVTLSHFPLAGSVVADFADARDLDLVFNGVSLEDAARCIAGCVRQRRWTVPDPRSGKRFRWLRIVLESLFHAFRIVFWRIIDYIQLW